MSITLKQAKAKNKLDQFIKEREQGKQPPASRRGRRVDFDSFLDKVPDVPPMPNDQL